MLLEEQFEKAKGDASFRQQFLDQIELGDISRFVRSVRYNPHQGMKGDKPASMSCSRNINILLGMFYFLTFRKSNINVYPFAFDDNYLPTINYFLNVLIDHEGQHAKDCYFNPFIVFNDQKMEFNAYRNEMIQSE